MEPLKPLQQQAATSIERKQPGASVSVSSTLSPLVSSFAKQQHGVVLGSSVASKTPALTTGTSGKQLSALASFAKSQHLQQPPEPLQPVRVRLPNSSSRGPQHASLSKESPLAAFAKSFVPLASGKAETTGALEGAAAAATSPSSKLALKRLNSTSKPKSLKSLPQPDSPTHAEDEDVTPTSATDSQAKEVHDDADISQVKRNSERDSKENSAYGGDESSDSFSDMDEANILHSDDDKEDGSEDERDFKAASSREARSQLDTKAAEAELYASRDQGAQPKYVRRTHLSP